MEDRKVNVLFYMVVIFFIAVIIMLIKDFNAKRLNDYKTYSSIVTNVIRQKNSEIRLLFNQLTVMQKENENLQSTLTDTRNSLDAISSKLAQPAPAAATK